MGNTKKNNVSNKKSTLKHTEASSKIKLSKKFSNKFGGGEPCATGCTDGNLGNLAAVFLKTAIDTVELIFDIGETTTWMTIEMPIELVGAIESPSVNTPLTNII